MVAGGSRDAFEPPLAAEMDRLASSARLVVHVVEIIGANG